MLLHLPFPSQILEPTPPTSILRSMDHFLAPSTPEALAHSHLTYVACQISSSNLVWHWYIIAKMFSIGTPSIPPQMKLFSLGVPLIRPLIVILVAQIFFCCPDRGVSLKASCELLFWLGYVSWFHTLSRRRYSYDAIHNAIAKSRSTLERGGYSRVSGHPLFFRPSDSLFLQACHLAEKSIEGVLNTGDNVETLLALHRGPAETDLADLSRSPRSIRSNWLFLFCPVTRRLVVFLAALLFCFVFVSPRICNHYKYRISSALFV